MKKVLSGICAAVLLAVMTCSVIAANVKPEIKQLDKKTVEATFTIDTTDPAYQADPPEMLEHAGKKYKLLEVTSQTIIAQKDLTEEQELTEAQTIEHLEAQEVPNTIAKEVDGQDIPLALKSVEYTPISVESGTRTATVSVNLGFYPTAPDAPQTEVVKYESPDGEKDAAGQLTGVTAGTKHWQDGYTITATYYGDSDVRYYDFGGVQIPNPPGDSVPYTGYEGAILSSLGLSADTVRINSASWTGSGTENGTPVRYATLACSRYGADYTATYTADVPDYVTEYTADAVYSAMADVKTGEVNYTISAVVQYEKTGMTAVQIVFTIALAILILLCILILFFLKKRREQNEKQKKPMAV